MAADTKRLDLRFGSFACSVQGFDDPVMPVQQVLRAIQHLLEETPELSDAGISFDAEAIESLVEEVARRADLASEDVEITPGLVIVHRGENDATAGYPVEGPTAEAEGEAWSRPFTGGNGADAGAAEAPAYVNIFAQQDASAADPEIPAEPEDEADLVAGRLGRVYEDNPAPDEAGARTSAPRDIFAETGSEDGSVFTDPLAAEPGEPAQEEADEPPLNLFANPRHETAEDDGPGSEGSIFAELRLQRDTDSQAEPSATADDADDADDETNRVQALFGDTGGLPEADETTDGYTVAGLAQAAGAENVADMMVSAAAWLVMLRGVTSFSRREVMDAFDQIPGDHEKSLEARIKGFGKAMRNGRIVMIEDGVFGLAQSELDRFEQLL